MNRIEEKIEEVAALLAKAEPEKVDHLEESFATLDMNKLNAYQGALQVAQLRGIITPGQSRTACRVLDEWADSPLAERVVVTKLMGELMGVSICR